jgi:preprotein translocase subunit SecE
MAGANKDIEQQTSWLERLSEEFRRVIAELQKVVWPTRDETTRLTIVVILISAAIGLFLYVSDAMFIMLYGKLLGLFQ